MLVVAVVVGFVVAIVVGAFCFSYRSFKSHKPINEYGNIFVFILLLDPIAIAVVMLL